jgi:hypothetical protein
LFPSSRQLLYLSISHTIMCLGSRLESLRLIRLQPIGTVIFFTFAGHLVESVRSTKTRDTFGLSIYFSQVYLLPCRVANSEDLIQSIGHILCIYHLEKGFVTTGVACNVQAVFINSGDLASALWSFVIAMHTLRWSTHRLSEGRRATRLSCMSNAFWQWGLCIGIWMLVIFLGTFGLQIQKWQPQNGGSVFLPMSNLFNISHLCRSELVLDQQQLQTRKMGISLWYSPSHRC